MDIQAYYEQKTGCKAIYRKNGADFHTLRYVRWLEQQMNCSEMSMGEKKLVSYLWSDGRSGF